MPLFVAIHKWKKENVKTVTRKVIEAMGKLPEGVNLCCSYLRADMTGAWCVWEAKSAEQIKNHLTKMVPEMETDVVPAIQWFPPSADIYAIMHTLIS